jgi:CBS domain-containing protein
LTEFHEGRAELLERSPKMFGARMSGLGMRCARAGEQLAEIEEVHEPAQTVSQQDRRDFRGAVSCRTHPATLVATRADGDLWPYPPPRAPVDDPNRNDISTERGTVMRTIEAVRRSAVGIGPERTIREAARMMEEAGVGALAVIQHEQLVGIVTDRDLVRRGLARDLPGDARVDAVMSAPVVTVDADADLHDTFALFRTHALRRLALVRGGQFVGMITVDDLLVDLAGDLSDLARPVTAEVIFGHHDSPPPATISG